MLVTLFASLGTPMIVAGDEFGRTQGGNNNAYCQDDEISWLDWSKLETERGAALFAFTRRVIDLRRHYASLHSRAFLHGAASPGEGVQDLEWWDERGERLSDEDWNNPDARALAMRRATRLGDGSVEVLALLLNAADDAITFALPVAEGERVLLVDSARPDQGEVAIGDSYELAGQGAALLRWTVGADG